MSTHRSRALVTGAARDRGIGDAIVQRLRAAGMEVVTIDVESGCTWQLDLAVDELPELGDIEVLAANHGLTTTFGAAHTNDARALAARSRCQPHR